MGIKRGIYTFLVSVLFVLLAMGSVAASGMGQNVRIGIREGRGSVIIHSPYGMEVVKNGTVVKKYSANSPVRLSLVGSSVAVDGKATGNVLIRPLKRNGTVQIADGYAYRGAMEIIKSPRRWGLTIVNVVPMEEYLYGVVGKEMSPSWSLEALKAQAVAARTYAIAHKNYFSSRGFDMTDDTSSQVYAGVNGESPSIIRAVDETRGEIITYDGKPIEALFMSSGGGYTENSENVWGSRIPYLRAVSDESDEMPSYKWSVATTPEKLGAYLTAAGKDVGKVYSISLTPLGKRPMSTPDRGVSGRVLSMTVRGSKGTVKVTGNAFQSIFGLKSTLFDFHQGKMPIPDADSAGKKRDTTLLLKAGMPLTIYGYGWGHGLGMSQYGAYQMAKNHGKANYYRTILAHYYTGTRIEKLY